MHETDSADAQHELRVPPLPAPLTALVGREQDLDALISILLPPETRLVTVTGAGGVGKTRLAIEAATQLAPAFEEAIAFVSLAGVTDPDLVMQTVAATIGVQSAPGLRGLLRAIGRNRLLLVLDNFEHVMAAGPAVATLLGACPGVNVLVTSRERLRIRGEREYPLAPLRLSADSTPGAAGAEAGEIPAVRLFIERVRDVRPGFTLSPENAGVAAEICRRLDGLPLAIELAAARSKVLPLPALLGRLEQRLPLLTDGPRDQPARQQTLERTIAWSYGLLSADEQRLFRRLSVFVGGFGIEAAEAVAAEDDEQGLVLDAIASLVDKSLLRRDEGLDDEARFSFLETVREYGLGRLRELGELEATQERHARWAIHYVETTWRAPWEGPVRRPRLDAFEREVANLRAALEWFWQHRDATSLLSMTGLLAPFWIMRSYRTEGRDWSERSLTMPGFAGAPAAVRARAFHAAASLVRTLGDVQRAIDLAIQGQALFVELGDQLGTAASINLLGALERSRGNLERAAEAFSEAVTISDSIPGSSWLALSRCNLGVVRLWQGDLHDARRLMELALADYRRRDDAFGVAFTLHGLSLVAGDEGDLAGAATYLAEDVSLSRDFGSKETLIDAVFGSGVVAARASVWQAAARLMAAATQQAASVAYSVEAPERARYDRAAAEAQSALAPDVWVEATAQGRAMTLSEAADTALESLASIAEHTAETRTTAGDLDLLSSREQEVIRLIAEGMSDRQIGEALFISHRTVMRHVANILAKLDVSSRGAASAWYQRQVNAR